MINSSLMQYRALLARQQLLHQQQQKRLARRIHDDISQQLTLLALQLSLANSDPKSQANWAQNCKQWSTMVLDLGQHLRSIINELQPRIIDELGLAAALQWYVNTCPKGIHCKLLLPEAPVALPPIAANELFAICRDIVSEIFAPNGITEATFALEQTHDQVRVHLRTPQQDTLLMPLISQGLDALSIHERLFCLDGAVKTHQDSAEGLAITLSLPTSQQAVSHAA
jgi:two-component system, NarL family, sensor histidine kinase UhpB